MFRMLRKPLACMFVVVICLAGCGEIKIGGFSSAAPSNLMVVSGQGTNGEQAILTWTASVSTTPSQGATFNVYRGRAATGTLADKTRIAEGLVDATYTDTFAGSTAVYQVTATIYGMESEPSNEVAFGAIIGPLTLTGGSASGVNFLSWRAYPGATGYLLYRGITPSGTLSNKIPWKFVDADSGVTSYTDTVVAVGVSYYYQIVAEYLNGRSLPSNEATITTQ